MSARPERFQVAGGGAYVEVLDGLIERLTEVLNDKTEDVLLDASGAGRILNVPASWVLAEARAGRIPHVHFGRYVRFPRRELLAWADARVSGPRIERTGSQPVSKGGSSA